MVFTPITIKEGHLRGGGGGAPANRCKLIQSRYSLGISRPLSLPVSPSAMRKIALGTSEIYTGILLWNPSSLYKFSYFSHVNMTTGPVADFSNARVEYITIHKFLLSLHYHQWHPSIHFPPTCFINTNILVWAREDLCGWPAKSKSGSLTS